jgi:SAM-dependent methyltransferase
MVLNGKFTNKNKIWDKIAEKAIKSNRKNPIGNEKDNFYLTEAYVYLAKRVLDYIKKRKIRLLKTDLWNEAVYKNGSILREIFFKDKKIELFGIDISEKICQRAKKIDNSIKISKGDIRSLPFSGEFFDVVLDLSTIDHIPEENVSRAINEYRRVLKKKGLLLLVFWQRDLFLRFLNLMSLWIRKKPLIDGETQYAFSSRFVEGILNAKKFKIIKRTSIGIIFPLVSGWEIMRPIFRYFPKLFYKILVRIEFLNLFPLSSGRLKVIIAQKIS